MYHGEGWDEAFAYLFFEVSDHFSPIRSCIHAFTDKIEFLNAGSLPMPAEQMVRTFYSSLRNPTIAKLFRFANISENVRFGMGKLFSWKQLTGNEVICESDRNVVRVIFFLKNNLDKVETVNPTDELELDVKTLQKRLGEKLGVKYSVIAFLNEKLGENRLSLLFLLYFSPKITGQTIAKILDISTTSVDNHIKWFKEREVLERIGNDRNGYWKINID